MTASKTPLLEPTPSSSSSSTIVKNYGATGTDRNEDEEDALLLSGAKKEVKVGKKFSEIWVLCMGLWASIFCSAIGECEVLL